MMKKRVDKFETKEEKFKRLASSRTQRILENLRLLGNCSNKALYSYIEKDIRKIFEAIEDEVKRVKSMFSQPKNKEFKL